MRRRRDLQRAHYAFLPALACGILLAACGSSHHQGTTTATSAASRPTASNATTAGTPTAPTASASSTQAITTRGTPTGGASNVRLPATFVVGPGGALAPLSITSPAFLAVDLTVISKDSRAHRVMLRTPLAHVLNVAPGGRASLLIPGLKAGRYAIDVDGVPRGALVTGGEPGP